jgi:selenocysteine lyase/cysteine desulfurase
MTLLPSQRFRFDIPAEVTYLNCAYMSPLLHEAVAAGQQAMARKAQPWRVAPADFFRETEGARSSFARLLGAPARADDIAIVPAASYGMAVACLNLPLKAGQRVLALDQEFPSTILSWRERTRAAGAELALIPRPSDDDWTARVLEQIDGRTAVVALQACHWIDGARIDLAQVRRRLNEVGGGALVLDLTQSLGVMPFDLASVDPDFLVAASYKWLLGPYTVGFLYVAPRQQGGKPLEESWFKRAGSENFSALTDYAEGYQPGARRYDMGEPSNFALLPPAVTAMDQIVAWGIDNMYETIGALTDRLAEGAARIGLTSVPAPLRARHYIGLRFPTGIPAGLPERLAQQQIFVSVRGGQSLRVTPHLYNDAADIDRLLGVLESAGRRG